MKTEILRQDRDSADVAIKAFFLDRGPRRSPLRFDFTPAFPDEGKEALLTIRKPRKIRKGETSRVFTGEEAERIWEEALPQLREETVNTVRVAVAGGRYDLTRVFNPESTS